MPKEFVSGAVREKLLDGTTAVITSPLRSSSSISFSFHDVSIFTSTYPVHTRVPANAQREGAGDRRVTRRAGSVRIPTRRRLQRWRENTRRHEPRCVAVSVARGRDERNGHPAFRSPVLGRHNPIPPAAAPAWRAVGSAFGREFPCFRPGIEAEFDSLTLDRGRGIVCRFPRHYRPYEDPIVAMGPLAAPLSA
jgi:hypothetical protein